MGHITYPIIISLFWPHLHQLHCHFYRIDVCLFFSKSLKAPLDLETYSTQATTHHSCWTECFITKETKCLKHHNLTHFQF